MTHPLEGVMHPSNNEKLSPYLVHVASYLKFCSVLFAVALQTQHTSHPFSPAEKKRGGKKKLDVKATENVFITTILTTKKFSPVFAQKFCT